WSEQESFKGFHNSSPAGIDDRLIKGAESFVKVPMNLSKGQVSFHHCLTIHGSDPNRSHRPRFSLSVHMQDERNGYRESRDKDGKLVWHRNDILCRMTDGIPDYADPDFCPILWTGETASSPKMN